MATVAIPHQPTSKVINLLFIIDKLDLQFPKSDSYVEWNGRKTVNTRQTIWDNVEYLNNWLNLDLRPFK